MCVGEIWGKESISNFSLLWLQNFREMLPRSTLSTSGLLGWPYLHNGCFIHFFKRITTELDENSLLLCFSPYPRQHISLEIVLVSLLRSSEATQQSFCGTGTFCAWQSWVLWQEATSLYAAERTMQANKNTHPLYSMKEASLQSLLFVFLCVFSAAKHRLLLLLLSHHRLPLSVPP